MSPETIVKRDADFISNSLQEQLLKIQNVTQNLERQANKLFGYIPEEPAADPLSKSTYSTENAPVLELLALIDKEINNLQDQSNRF